MHEEIINIIIYSFDVFAKGFVLITILLSILVRLTPRKSDDEFLDSSLERILKVMSYFPTLGINPRTKALERMCRNQKNTNNDKNWPCLGRDDIEKFRLVIKKIEQVIKI